MKVLSLLQPWASLVVTPKPNSFITGPRGKQLVGIKQWETRCWRPKNEALIEQLKTEGFLIHASKGWKKLQSELVNAWPFNEYKDVLPKQLPLGMIIGHVKLVDIWTSDKWLDNFKSSETERTAEEYHFGDYSPLRYAWLLSNPILFEKPIQASGALNFWDWNEPVPELITKY